MHLNSISEWKVMTIWICRGHPLFNFKRLDILCPRIRHPCEKLWPFNFLGSFLLSISSVSISYVPKSDIRVKCYDHLNFLKVSVVPFWVSRYIRRLNRKFESKVMTIRISRELPLFNFEHLNILCSWIGHPCEKLWPFKFLKRIRCSISIISIYYAPESDIREKSYDQLNFSRASVVQFRASRYNKHLNRTSELKFITIWISREFSLFNFNCLDILCPWSGHPC